MFGWRQVLSAWKWGAVCARVMTVWVQALAHRKAKQIRRRHAQDAASGRLIARSFGVFNLCVRRRRFVLECLLKVQSTADARRYRGAFRSLRQQAASATIMRRISRKVSNSARMSVRRVAL